MLPWPEGRPGGRTGYLAVTPQGKAAFAARAPDGSGPLRKPEGMCLRKRDLPRSRTKGAQLQAPSAPPPGTGQGSPAGPSQGSSSVTGTLAATVVNGKKERLFWKLNLMLFAPCLHPGGMVRASPSPLLCSGLPLGSASLCFSRGPGSDCKGPPRRHGGGVEGNSPAAWGQAGHPPAFCRAGSPGHGQGNLPRLQPSPREFACRLIKCLEILPDERHCINLSVNPSYARKHLSGH